MTICVCQTAYDNTNINIDKIIDINLVPLSNTLLLNK